ncbi:hypothetical protein K488DRAFT_71339 [Vararia minispora EC-137]|uniref:Uncharacterized protein n=1 Tax=Vararia minispora EC-137 TaxID=1314806 RepID=A0ACB8QI64_9AGAM|nr:hypothetical protein K488DRAFT_71339 [Vararia minispora EC-137]
MARIEMPLMFGFISWTFGPKDASEYFAARLQIGQPAVVEVDKDKDKAIYIYSTSLVHRYTQYNRETNEGVPPFLLDYYVEDGCSVVRQKIYTTRHETKGLQLPIFFFEDGQPVGISLRRASGHDTYGLRGAKEEAPLGLSPPKVTTFRLHEAVPAQCPDTDVTHLWHDLQKQWWRFRLIPGKAEKARGVREAGAAKGGQLGEVGTYRGEGLLASGPQNMYGSRSSQHQNGVATPLELADRTVIADGERGHRGERRVPDSRAAAQRGLRARYKRQFSGFWKNRDASAQWRNKRLLYRMADGRTEEDIQIMHPEIVLEFSPLEIIAEQEASQLRKTRKLDTYESRQFIIMGFSDLTHPGLFISSSHLPRSTTKYTSLTTMHNAPSHYLTDHCLALMMGPDMALRYISALLRTDANMLLHIIIPYVTSSHPYVQKMFIVPTSRFPAPQNARQLVLGREKYWVLDYIPDPQFGVVIQQPIYTPSSHGVQREGLLSPIFFWKTDGTLGIPLVHASAKMTHTLAENQYRINVRGKTTTKFIITMQWPGYEAFERQVELQDSKHEPITHGRLATRVGNFLDDFLTVR